MSVLKTNSIQPTTPGSEDYFLARAWVNFSGTGTVAIRGDGNVTSITDNGTGSYTVNFATAMSDGNYSISGFCRNNVGVFYGMLTLEGVPLASNTGQLRAVGGPSSDTSYDPLYVFVAIFR